MSEALLRIDVEETSAALREYFEQHRRLLTVLAANGERMPNEVEEALVRALESLADALGRVTTAIGRNVSPVEPGNDEGPSEPSRA